MRASNSTTRTASEPPVEGLMVTFRGGRAQVRVIAPDLVRQRRLEALARWVERLLAGLRWDVA